MKGERLECPDIDEKVILKWVLEKQDMTVWYRLVRFRIWSIVVRGRSLYNVLFGKYEVNRCRPLQ